MSKELGKNNHTITDSTDTKSLGVEYNTITSLVMEELHKRGESTVIDLQERIKKNAFLEPNIIALHVVLNCLENNDMAEERKVYHGAGTSAYWRMVDTPGMKRYKETYPLDN